MIECQHKNVMPILNMGIFTEYCFKHGKFVNNTICGQCSDHEGKLDHPPAEIDFPLRKDKEVESIHGICSACPLFRIKEQLCSKIQGNMIPIDTLAQHPSNHCPENLW